MSLYEDMTASSYSRTSVPKTAPKKSSFSSSTDSNEVAELEIDRYAEAVKDLPTWLLWGGGRDESVVSPDMAQGSTGRISSALPLKSAVQAELTILVKWPVDSDTQTRGVRNLFGWIRKSHGIEPDSDIDTREIRDTADTRETGGNRQTGETGGNRQTGETGGNRQTSPSLPTSISDTDLETRRAVREKGDDYIADSDSTVSVDPAILVDSKQRVLSDTLPVTSEVTVNVEVSMPLKGEVAGLLSFVPLRFILAQAGSLVATSIMVLKNNHSNIKRSFIEAPCSICFMM